MLPEAYFVLEESFTLMQDGAYIYAACMYGYFYALSIDFIQWAAKFFGLIL